MPQEVVHCPAGCRVARLKLPRFWTQATPQLRIKMVVQKPCEIVGQMPKIQFHRT